MRTTLRILALASLSLFLALPLAAGNGPGGPGGPGEPAGPGVPAGPGTCDPPGSGGGPGGPAVGGPGSGPGAGCDGGLLAAYLESLPVEPLSEAEGAALVYMRQEEKMARDLYLLFADRFGERPFARIAEAEQRHMDLVGTLLARYGIADPIAGLPEGLFADAGLQALYDVLAATGRESRTAALTVGALVEETDLADLLHDLEIADNRDLDAVFQNLAKGSRNHLRAYVEALARQGATYVPEVLDPALFASIVESEKERGGPVDENGLPLGGGPGTGDCDGTGPDA
jgi:hypothetical protein